MTDADHPADQRQARFSSDSVDALRPSVYPIEELDQLLSVIGPDTLLAVRGSEVRAVEAGPLIPPYYFPISNAADFKSKLADLAELGPLSEQELYDEWAQGVGQQSPAPTDCWS